jgi:GGDEF domain-containing protein
LVARGSGDDFLVLLKDFGGEAGVLRVAERIARKLRGGHAVAERARRAGRVQVFRPEIRADAVHAMRLTRTCATPWSATSCVSSTYSGR